MSNSTAKSKAVKPTKPHKDFPLFAHATGRWAKKVRGKLHYFGPWNAPDQALDLWLLQKDDLLAGRKPRDTQGGFTIRSLANHFLTFKQHQRELGEITSRTFNDYKRTCELLIDVFGRNREVADLRADDFAVLRTELAKSRGPTTLHNEIGRVRVVFNFAYQNPHISELSRRQSPEIAEPQVQVLDVLAIDAGLPQVIEKK